MATVPNPFNDTPEAAPTPTPVAPAQTVPQQPALPKGPVQTSAPSDPPQVDMRIYGGTAPNQTPLPAAPNPDDFEKDDGTSDYTPPDTVPYAESVSKGLMSLHEGDAQRAAAARPTDSVFSSMGAAAQEWSPMKVLDWWNEPKYPPEAGFSPNALMDQLPFTPSDTEDKFLRSASSTKQYVSRAAHLNDQRELQQRMGSHPVLSTLLTIADPGYLALDAIGGYAGHAAALAGLGARGARLTAAAAAGGGAYALGKATQETTPMSDGEVVTMALINAAVGGVAYRAKTGKMEPLDPNYPTRDLTDSANALKRTVPEPEVQAIREETPAITKPTPELQFNGEAVQKTDTPLFDRSGAPIDTRYMQDLPSVPASVHLDRIANGSGEFAPLARALQDVGGELFDNLPVKEFPATGNTSPAGERAFYHSGEHAVYTAASATDQTILHEISHGATVQKIEYGLANPGTVHGQLVSQLEDLRQMAIKQSKDYGDMIGMNQPHGDYYNKNLKEFVAGLFSGNTPFTRMLADMPHSDGGSMLGRLVGTVRKMLGMAPNDENVLTKAMGLTEDLIKNPLDVKMRSGDTLSFAPHGDMPQIAQQIIAHEDGKAAKLSKELGMASKTGQFLSISMHKTMSGMGSVGRKVADLLIDDPVHMRGDSVISQQRAIRAELQTKQFKYEDALKSAMAEDGFGNLKSILQSRKASQVQAGIEKDVHLELLRRDKYISQGLPVPASEAPLRIQKMADLHGDTMKAALRELKASGRPGLENITENAGYVHRRWSITQLEALEQKLVNGGQSLKQAKGSINDMLAQSLRKANPSMTDEVAKDVANAIANRTRAKGYFEDSAFNMHQGADAAKKVRDILEGSGISDERLQRAMDSITGVNDEKGKAAFLKRRLDMDMDASIRHSDGSVSKVSDLLDSNLTRNLDDYLNKVSGNSALSRKGLHTQSDISNLKSEFLHGIANEADRFQANRLFDDTIKLVKGQPVGEAMNATMRKMSALTQAVSLGGSGIWQLADTASIMAKYGMMRTVKEMFKTMPGAKALFNAVRTDAETAGHLSTILSHNSAQDMRMRPFLHKMEDNFELPASDTLMMSLQQSKQLVPYLNGLRYVHHAQANMVGNLISDTVVRAAKGDKKAISMLGQYGLESHVLDGIKSDISAHGMNVDKWADSSWHSVRGPLNKMMDDAVLRNRTGELPAFVHTSQVGKFLFTYRSFMLGAHNKILAGSLGRNGFAGLGLMMAYQYPLHFLAVSAMEGMANKKKPKTEGQIARAAMAQMSALGMLGDLVGVMTGDKNSFGAPGLSGLDKLYKIGATAPHVYKTGKFGNTAAATWNAMPYLSIIPFNKAIAEHLKD